MIAVPDLEVIICTYNRSQLLRRTILSLNQANRPPGRRIALLVIENACDDETATLLDTYPAWAETPDPLPLRWNTEEQPGKSYALNRALRMVRGKLLAFVDDDHRVDGGFFDAIIAAAVRYPEAAAFCGRIVPDWRGDEPAWLREEGRWMIRPPPVPIQDWGPDTRILGPSDRLPGGGNLVCRREAALANGPFRADLGPKGHDLGGGEDGEWIRRAVERGLILRYVPNLVQYHYVDPERLRLRYLVAKAYRRSRTSTRLAPDTPKQVPLYMWRKLLAHAGRALVGPDMRRRRFYLVRTAATLGEVSGILDRAADRKRATNRKSGLPQ